MRAEHISFIWVTIALVSAMSIVLFAVAGEWAGVAACLLLFACFAAVSIRWAGVFGVAVILACLLNGQWKPKLTTTWVTSALVVIVSLVTFFGWRYALRGTAEQAAAAADMVTGTSEDTGTMPAPDPGPAR